MVSSESERERERGEEKSVEERAKSAEREIKKLNKRRPFQMETDMAVHIYIHIHSYCVYDQWDSMQNAINMHFEYRCP